MVIPTAIETIFCDGKNPPVFTFEQIQKCHQCFYISRKRFWCRLFWVIVKEEGKELQPYLNTKHAGFATKEDRFRHHYLIAANRANENSEEIVEEDVFMTRRKACAECPPEDKQGCPCMGCKQWHKLVLADVECPKNKW